MKKTLFAIVSLALLAMGCVKEQQPSETPAGQSDVTVFKVTVAQTKVAVDETSGACTWQEGDQLAVWYVSDEDETTGKKVIFTYDSDYTDGSAKFVTTEDVAGYTAVRAAHPVNSVTEAGFSLVRDWTYDPERRPVYVRTENITVNPDGSLSAQLTHNASVFKFTLHDIPAYAAGFVLESVKYDVNGAGEFIDGDGNVIEKEDAVPSQTIQIKTLFPYKTGYTADPSDHSNDIRLYSVAAHSSYLTRVYLIDGDGTEIEGSEKKFKQTWNDVSTDDFIELPMVDFQKANLRRDYVKIGGVKWAKGNLQYFKDNGQDGFQDGWRLAPTQWHHMNYTLKESTANNKNKYTGDRINIGATNSADAFEHYNMGGVGANSRLLTQFITPTSEVLLELSGKIYSDPQGKNEVKDETRFASNATLYGDLAFWASKGIWRLPKASEMAYLNQKTHKVSAYYVTSDGYKVWGSFYYPIVMGNRIMGDNKIEINDLDLEYGVFLPNAGRRAEANEDVIIHITNQGHYRTGTYYLSKTVNSELKYYSAYFNHSAGTGHLYDDKTYGTQSFEDAKSHKAGFSIRPVLVEE